MFILDQIIMKISKSNASKLLLYSFLLCVLFFTGCIAKKGKNNLEVIHRDATLMITLEKAQPIFEVVDLINRSTNLHVELDPLIEALSKEIKIKSSLVGQEISVYKVIEAIISQMNVGVYCSLNDILLSPEFKAPDYAVGFDNYLLLLYEKVNYKYEGRTYAKIKAGMIVYSTYHLAKIDIKNKNQILNEEKSEGCYRFVLSAPIDFISIVYDAYLFNRIVKVAIEKENVVRTARFDLKVGTEVILANFDRFLALEDVNKENKRIGFELVPIQIHNDQTLKGEGDEKTHNEAIIKIAKVQIVDEMGHKIDKLSEQVAIDNNGIIYGSIDIPSKLYRSNLFLHLLVSSDAIKMEETFAFGK